MNNLYGNGADHLEGWYSSSVVLPDPGSEVIWIDADGQETTGTYDLHGRWFASCGRGLMYVPLQWRQPAESALTNPRMLPTLDDPERFVEQDLGNALWCGGSLQPSGQSQRVVGLLHYNRASYLN